MRRLSTSRGYARFRLTLGSLFIVLGAVIIGRTIAGVGIRVEELPAVALGALLIALGATRIVQALAILRSGR